MQLTTIKDFQDKYNNMILRTSKNENCVFEENDKKRARFLIDNGYCLEVKEEQIEEKAQNISREKNRFLDI